MALPISASVWPLRVASTAHTSGSRNSRSVRRNQPRCTRISAFRMSARIHVHRFSKQIVTSSGAASAMAPNPREARIHVLATFRTPENESINDNSLKADSAAMRARGYCPMTKAENWMPSTMISTCRSCWE